MPALEDLPTPDADLLASIQILGHFPRDLNGTALETATTARKNERNLYQRFKRRKKTMHPQCLAFIDAVKDLGGVRQALAAASSVPVAPSPGSTSFSLEDRGSVRQAMAAASSVPVAPSPGGTSSSLGQASELAPPPLGLPSAAGKDIIFGDARQKISRVTGRVSVPAQITTGAPSCSSSSSANVPTERRTLPVAADDVAALLRAAKKQDASVDDLDDAQWR